MFVLVDMLLLTGNVYLSMSITSLTNVHCNVTALRGCGRRCRALREQVDLALKGLDLRPRNILRYRYGLHTALGRPLTLNEVQPTETMPGFSDGRFKHLHLAYSGACRLILPMAVIFTPSSCVRWDCCTA